MTNDWVTEYRKAVARLLAEKGSFVSKEAYPRDDWHMDEPDPTDYDDGNTVYGWREIYHGNGGQYGSSMNPNCLSIISWNYDSLRERTLSLFDNTFTDNKDEHGMEMRATCQCGEYTDRWVRWIGTMSEALEILLRGNDAST